MCLLAFCLNETLGLHSFELLLPDSMYISELADRLDNNDISYTMGSGDIQVADPLGTRIHIISKPELVSTN